MILMNKQLEMLWEYTVIAYLRYYPNRF